MKNNSIGISVIIPTFNRAKFLYPTLICLLNQDLQENIDYEIIVIDSGDDDTSKVINYIRQKAKINIIYKKITKCKNRSLLRNKGIKYANYEILVFLDNDMLVPPLFINDIYQNQKDNKNQIYLYYRKSLIEFSMNKIGEEVLEKHFELLDELPYYNDERIELVKDVESWRYLFSHTFSIHKSKILQVAGFNKSFGNNWGLEDLELGFKLSQIDTTYKYSEYYSYHQPHFAQSNKEQNKTDKNARLFLKLHNCFEVELYLTLYNDFDKEYAALKQISEKENSKIDIYSFFDIIVGRVYSRENKKNNKKERLGLFIPEKKKFNNVLIASDFFKLSKRIQYAILGQTFKCAKKVFVLSKDNEYIAYLKQLCFDINIIIEITKKKKGLIEIVKTAESNKTAISCILPDVLNFENRIIFQWLLYRIHKNNVLLNLKDSRNEKYFIEHEYSLPLSYVESLHSCFKTSYGFIDYRNICSLSSLHNDISHNIDNNQKTFILDDDVFLYKINSLKIRSYENCIHIDSNCYNLLTFMCVEDIFHLYKSQKFDNKDKLCCFMNNGYYEDGIDIILESFKKYHEINKSAKLSIKISNLDDIFKDCYSLHNNESKKSKEFKAYSKRKTDILLLEKKIDLLNIREFITFETKTLSLLEIFDFIDKHSTLIHSSRYCTIPPQVFISILLGKKTVIGQHHKLMFPFTDYCEIIPSTLVNAYEELKVPKNNSSLLLSVGKCDIDVCVEILKNSFNKSHIDSVLINQLKNISDELYQRIQNRNVIE